MAKNHGGKGAKEIEIDDLIVVIQRIDTDMEQLREIANAIVEEGKVAVLGSGNGGAKIVVAVPKGGGLHAGKILNGLAEIIGSNAFGFPLKSGVRTSIVVAGIFYRWSNIFCLISCRNYLVDVAKYVLMSDLGFVGTIKTKVWFILDKGKHLCRSMNINAVTVRG